MKNANNPNEERINVCKRTYFMVKFTQLLSLVYAARKMAKTNHFHAGPFIVRIL